MRFRLIEKDASGNKTGPHYMGPVRKGRFTKVIRPGEILESDQPLDVLFRNKFERVSNSHVEPAEVPQKTKKNRK